MTTRVRTLHIEELTSEAFAPFGQVIAARAGVPTFAINAGFATRFHDLAQIDVAEQAGRVCISVFQALPRSMPMQLQVMERHPLGSQAFVAMSELPFLVVVAPAAKALDLGGIRCFYAAAGQGVNYAKGTWHHPLIALERASDFLVIDRGGGAGASNLEEVDVRAAALWLHT
jgi:ureidoglycolate lyase